MVLQPCRILFRGDNQLLLSFHDFRMINGAEKKKLIFDLEIPYSYKKKDCDRVIGQIGALMKEMDEKCECVVNIDKKYVAGE